MTCHILEKSTLHASHETEKDLLCCNYFHFDKSCCILHPTWIVLFLRFEVPCDFLSGYYDIGAIAAIVVGMEEVPLLSYYHSMVIYAVSLSSLQ